MMPPRTLRDVDALQLGFLADGILHAIRAAERGSLGDNDREHLKTGLRLLQGLASGVGTTVSTESQFHLTTLSTFPYAAEALKAVPSSRLSEGFRSHFSNLAETLERILREEDVSDEDETSLTEFFRGLSGATLDSWSSAQSPTILGTERSPWKGS